MIKLYDYYRSSACYRVRIALNIKNIAYEKIPIHLVQNGGEQHSSEYKQLNPQGLVPSLIHEGRIISQSLAIIDYLEAYYPEPALLPIDPYNRANVNYLALIIACDMHPLNNLRVLNQLKAQFNADETLVMQWYYHWLQSGFEAFEAKLKTLDRSEPVCFGDNLSLADLCLIPQVYNAKRFNFPMDDYPIINEIDAYCGQLPAFKNAAPD